MGFSWDFSGSTLIKRLCKSLLKKKLGDLLLGDIDLDQLDVQLTTGTLHLSDLALNADFINEKMVGSTVILKEGSMKSLSIKIPLKLKSCEIEIEELELIIAPYITTDIPISSSDCSTSSSNTEPQHAKDPQKSNAGHTSFNSVTSRDVDEGVKKIANAVKWFLTSFHVRIKNVYILFDPSTIPDVRNSASNRSLVLRIKETEFGTCLSEDASVKLNNFMNFKEAALEFLQMDELEKNNSSIGDITTSVLKGPVGGFSGTLNLSIPWKNGSLSLQKLDADVSVDALELNVRPSTIDWALAVWQSMQLISSKSSVHKGMELSAFSPRLNMSSVSTTSKVEVPTAKVQEITQDEFLGGTHFIQNWVPKLSDKDEQGAVDSDYDDDLSIDQFFECFEGMRSSQMGSGNSGIWNWTCSVFNAITFADTLATGVNHLPPEQLTEKTLHVSMSETCIIIFLDDRRPVSREGRDSEFYMSCFSSMNPDQPSTTNTDTNNIKLQHLEARFQDIFLDFETYPQNLKLKASIGQISLDEFYDGRYYEQILLTPHLKRNIQGCLPPFSFNESDDGRCGTNSKVRLIRVSLLKSFGKCNIMYATSFTGSDGNSTTSSLVMSLPPLTFWVHFHLIYMLIQLTNQVDSYLNKSPRITQTEVTKSSVKSGHRKSSFKGRIILKPSRIFLCFPSEFSQDFSRPSLFEKFLVFDHFLTLNLKELEIKMSEDCQTSSSSSVHLDVQNLDAYLIEPCNQNFSATKIISTSNSTVEHGFGINFSWQTGRVTDPWILSRAWNLATLHNQKSVERHAGKGSGFSSSTSLGDLHDMCTNIRQELILSTQSLLHVKLSRVLIDLSKKHYVLLLSLIDQAVQGLSKNAVNTSKGEVEEKEELISNDNSSLQTSIFLECGTLDVCAWLNEVMEVSHLLQRELKGSWKGLKLCIKDFELLSVSNLGGFKDARFLWLNHGEGKLFGSIINQPQISDMESNEDFLLVVCSDSSSGRGDGAGTNALSCGKSGTSFITIFNPVSLETYTSVIVSCATLVAPGARLDWIQAIILFFTLPSRDVEEPSMDGAVRTPITATSSFYLDLVDVALSYEPHAQKPTEYTETSNLGPSFFLEPNAEMEKQAVACLLAASSLSLSNNTLSNSNSIDHDIHLQDLGLLICESDGSEIIAHGSSPDYLRRVGYVRVAQNTLIAAALRTSGCFWKLEMTDSSFNISVCRDTLFGLIRLASQLQQIYAPDMQDAVAHLQSRWNSMQLKETEGLGPSHSRVSECEPENVSVSQEGYKSGGLLDEIVENAFYTEEQNGPFDYYAVNLPYEDAEVSSGGVYVSSFSPEIIDAYCSPDFPSSSVRSRVSASSNEDTDRGNGGWYGDPPLNIVENHISEARNSTEGESSIQGGSYYFDTVESAEIPCNLKGQVALTSIDVSLRMFAGNDWSDRSKEISSCSSHVNQRDGDACLELVLSGLDLSYDMYPDDEIRVSKMYISSQDMNLFDQSKNAPWKMILGWYSSKDYRRESCSKAFKLELESIRPEPLTPLEDYRLQLEILPLQLHLDQGQLNFLVNFFQDDSSRDPDSSGLLPRNSDQLETSARESISSSGSQAIVEEALLPFFQKFDIRPLVVRVDYIPRQFDPVALSRGNYAEILNLVPWKGIDLKLKSVSAVGVYGWGSICETILGEWLEDISHNQVHNLLKGLPPIRSLFAVSSGTSKLISLPIKSYRKDGKLLKGMQRGAVAFIRSISIEAVGLGVHLAAGAHEMLLKTECILTAVPPMPQSDRRRKPNVRLNQPEDAQQGIQQAYESLTEGLGRTASAIIRTPLKVYQHGTGAGSALATAVCSAPGAVIAPISASAGAVHYALLGLRNSLDPEHKRESMDKYHGPSQL